MKRTLWFVLAFAGLLAAKAQKVEFYTPKTVRIVKEHGKAVDYAGNRSKDSEELTTAIEAPVVAKDTKSSGWFDTNGLPATPATQGILIQEGKKVFNR